MRFACVLGFLGVALGAFGAHALRGKVEPGMLENYKTGVLYHFIHAIALLVWAHFRREHPDVGSLAGWAFTAGIVLFSGSLYLMTVTGMRWLGAVTPVGGLLFLVGWAAFAWKV